MFHTCNSTVADSWHRTVWYECQAYCISLHECANAGPTLLCNQIEQDSLRQYPNQPSASANSVPASAAASNANFLYPLLVSAKTHDKGIVSDRPLMLVSKCRFKHAKLLLTSTKSNMRRSEGNMLCVMAGHCTQFKPCCTTKPTCTRLSFAASAYITSLYCKYLVTFFVLCSHEGQNSGMHKSLKHDCWRAAGGQDHMNAALAVCQHVQPVGCTLAQLCNIHLTT